jgi:hypothetical protein
LALVSKMIPGLFGGVSQQPSGIRLDSQCEAMDDFMPSVANGIEKRNPWEKVAIPSSTALGTTSYVHFIDRDSSEQYIVINRPSTAFLIYSLAGALQTVQYGYWDEDGGWHNDNSSLTYAVVADPLADSRMLTVADHTFMVNKTVTVEKSGVVETQAAIPVGLVYIKLAVANTTYKVYVDGTEQASYATGAAPSTLTVATQLYSTLSANLGANFTVVQEKNVIAINRIDGTDFSLDVADSYGSTAMIGIKERTGSLADLPPSIPASLGYPTWSVNIAQASALEYYQVLVDGNLVGEFYQSGWGGVAAQTIINDLFSDFSTNLTALDADYRWSQSSATGFNIWRVDDTPFTVTTKVGTPSGDNDHPTWMTASDLGDSGNPPIIFIGGLEENSEGYYVKWNLEDENARAASGQWVECTKDGLDNNLDETTMPHKLVRGSDGIFRFGPINWEPRVAGDEDSAPDPSFVGEEITDIFLHKSRLGFIAKDTMVMSRTSDFYNLYPHSALEVTDDDPIDISPSASDVAIFQWAVPYHSDLVLFSDRDQFIVTAGDRDFGPKTVAIDRSISNQVSTLCKPIAVGANIYFVSPRGTWASLIEHYVTANSVTNDIADVSAHAPSYLPSGIHRLLGSEVFNVIFGYAVGDSTLYGYRYFWSGDQKAQSAWFKLTCPMQILGMHLYGSWLYVVGNYNTDLYIWRMKLETQHTTGTLDFPVLLDNLFSVATGVYDSGVTTWTYPDADANATTGYYEAVYDDDGTAVDITTQTSTYIRAAGDHSTRKVWIGIPYTANYEFSKFGPKDGDANVKTLQGRLQVRTLSVAYEDTAIFTLSCTPKDRAEYTKDFTNVNIQGDALGAPDISTGVGRFFVLGNADQMVLKLVVDEPYPARFVSAAWEGYYTARNRSIR